jgi:membrane protease subunit (stomatin/prohibitin family)
MTTLRSWKYGFESPFKAEVYFVSTVNFIDMKWGTQNPIMMRDSELGVVRLRAFGTYNVRVTDPGAVIRQVVGTGGCFTTEDVDGQLRSMLVSAFTGVVGKTGIAALDLASNYRAIGEQAREIMDPEFRQYGISLTRFVIENISVPPEVEKMLDVRSQMGIVGNDMARFTQFQSAQAITEAAKSGGAGEFLGMGAGIAMGQQMASAMASSMKIPASGPPQQGQPEASGAFCSQCGKAVLAGAKFCSECGAPMQATCPQCGKTVDPTARFCQECGTKLK